MLGKVSIIGTVATILMIPAALSAQMGGALNPSVHVGGAVNPGATVRGAVERGIPGLPSDAEVDKGDVVPRVASFIAAVGGASASRVRIYARRDNARKTVMHSQHIRPITVANIVSIALNERAYIMA